MKLSELKKLCADLEATCEPNEDPHVDFYTTNSDGNYLADYFTDYAVKQPLTSDLDFYFHTHKRCFQIPLERK